MAADGRWSELKEDVVITADRLCRENPDGYVAFPDLMNDPDIENTGRVFLGFTWHIGKPGIEEQFSGLIGDGKPSQVAIRDIVRMCSMVSLSFGSYEEAADLAAAMNLGRHSKDSA